MIKERPLTLVNGWLMFVVNLLIFPTAVAGFFTGVVIAPNGESPGVWLCIGSVVLFVAGVISCIGHIILMPNEACVYTLFGAYVGTARDSGFWWANPFRTKRKISLRARSMEVAKLKVNDKG